MDIFGVLLLVAIYKKEPVALLVAEIEKCLDEEHVHENYNICSFYCFLTVCSTDSLIVTSWN